MKQSITAIALSAMMIAACTGNKPQDTAFSTETLAYAQKSATADVTIKANYPTGGNATLTNAICEYISEQLGGTYTGNNTAGDSVVAYYGQQQTARMEEAAKALAGSAVASTYFSQEIKVLAETETYVTYTDYTETFLGGAHGMSSLTGTTFRKSDGRRFGREMLRSTDTEAFRLLLKEGLESYFAKNDTANFGDEELKQMLLPNNSIDYLPLPQAAPYLTEGGMVFTYQPYEIAPYAAGRPTFTVGYDKLKPFLTETVSKLIGNR